MLNKYLLSVGRVSNKTWQAHCSWLLPCISPKYCLTPSYKPVIQAFLQAYQHQALVSANTDLSNKFENSLSELQVTQKRDGYLSINFRFHHIRVAKIRQQKQKLWKLFSWYWTFAVMRRFKQCTVNNAIFLSDDQPSRHSDSIQGAKSSLCAVRAIWTHGTG